MFVPDCRPNQARSQQGVFSQVAEENTMWIHNGEYAQLYGQLQPTSRLPYRTLARREAGSINAIISKATYRQPATAHKEGPGDNCPVNHNHNALVAGLLVCNQESQRLRCDVPINLSQNHIQVANLFLNIYCNHTVTCSSHILINSHKRKP